MLHGQHSATIRPQYKIFHHLVRKGKKKTTTKSNHVSMTLISYLMSTMHAPLPPPMSRQLTNQKRRYVLDVVRSVIMSPHNQHELH